jgi:hypothetical protein
MRYIAGFLNLYLLGMVIFLFATEGAPVEEEWLIVIPMILAPLFSIIAIFTGRK